MPPTLQARQAKLTALFLPKTCPSADSLQSGLSILGLLGRLGKTLQLPRGLAHAPEAAALLGDQGMRVAELDDLALVQHQDLVVVDDGLQTVRNGDGGVLNQADRLLDLAVCRVVNRGCGFVHE